MNTAKPHVPIEATAVIPAAPRCHGAGPIAADPRSRAAPGATTGPGDRNLPMTRQARPPGLQERHAALNRESMPCSWGPELGGLAASDERFGRG